MSAATSTSWTQRIGGLKNPWSLAVIVVFAASIMLELADDYEVIDNGSCTYKQEQHEHRSEHLYGPLMSFRFGRLRQPKVGIVTIDSESEPLKVVNNTCEGRRFLSDVVPQLKEDGAQVIVIDKFYSAGSCGQEDVNESFRAALTRPSSTGTSVPVVVGQATHKHEAGSTEDACLQLVEPFDFKGKGADPHGLEVQLGVTRLNTDSLKIPLQWVVFPSPADLSHQEKNPYPDESLSLKAAKQVDKGILQRPAIRRAVSLREHPFGRFNELPQWSAMSVICSPPAGASPVSKEHWGSCHADPNLASDVRGKVVVIGEHSDTDLQPTRDKERYGVELQASYIEDLLDQTYLRRVPLWGELLMLISFVAVSFLLEIQEEEHRISALQSYGRWSTFYLLLVAFNFALLLFFNRLSSIFLSASWIMLTLILFRGASLLRQESIKKLHGTPEGSAE